MDKRRYQRFIAEGEVILKKKTDPSSPIQAHLVDISFAGLGLIADGPLEAGCDCLFELTIQPWLEKVSGEGKVRHAQETEKGDTKVFRMGLEFTSVDEKIIQNILNRIQQVICEQARKKEQPKNPSPRPGHF